MGRIDTDATQYHQGLQFQESHQTPPEMIDDAPPVDEDLYEPPSNYQPQYPPPQDHHPAAAVHSFPPPQEYNKPPPAQPFPPAYTNEKSTPPPAQAFPPPQEQTPQHFPSPNQYMHHQQQQQAPPNVAVMPQFPAAQHQPVAGGIPVGYSPSPFNQQFPTEPWKTSLFDCMRNPQNAIITLFFPCVTFGQIAEIVDAGNTSCGTSGMLYSLILFCIAMPCIMSCTYRTKLRSKYGLMESPAPDWVIHCFCEYCALCQEYRELEERGFHPAIGWMGNIAKQQQQGQQQFGMTPPMHQRMM